MEYLFSSHFWHSSIVLTSNTDQDCHDQQKRKRIRKRKSRKNVKKPNIVHVEQAELEKQPSLLQEKLQHQHTDGPSISKNKKRKLKKKRQIKRKKAASLVTKASGVNFMYQPVESHSEQENEGDSERGARDTSEEEARDADEEEVRLSNEKADGVLALLKLMQEAYFYDGMYLSVFFWIMAATLNFEISNK